MTIRILSTRIVVGGSTVIVARQGTAYRLVGNSDRSQAGRFRFSPGVWYIRSTRCMFWVDDGDTASYRIDLASVGDQFEGEIVVEDDQDTLYAYGPEASYDGTLLFLKIPAGYEETMFEEGFQEPLEPPEHPPLEFEAEWLALAKKFGVSHLLKPPTADYFDEDPDGDWLDDLEMEEDPGLPDSEIFPGATEDDDHDRIEDDSGESPPEPDGGDDGPGEGAAERGGPEPAPGRGDECGEGDSPDAGEHPEVKD